MCAGSPRYGINGRIYAFKIGTATWREKWREICAEKNISRREGKERKNKKKKQQEIIFP